MLLDLIRNSNNALCLQKKRHIISTMYEYEVFEVS